MRKRMPMARPRITRRTSIEVLESRSMLSAATPAAWHGASRVTAEHSTPAPTVVKSSAVVAPISSTDVNWAGYAIPAATNAVRSVAASWNVPAVNPKSSGYSATWVGIDGYSSNTVEQIGTEQDVIGGHVEYSAW